MADEGELVLDCQLVNGIGFVGQEMFLPAVTIGGRTGQTIVGLLMGLDAGQELGALPDEVQALAQERSQGALGRGISVGRRDEIGAEEMSELPGIDAVVFVFAAVNGFEVEGMG